MSQKFINNVRIDTGVEEGSEISMYYDPMISKTITWGQTRDEALTLMKQALKEYVIDGVTENCGFGLSICNNEAFASGKYDTSFIPTYYSEGFHGETLTQDDHHIIAITAAQIKNIHEIEDSIAGSSPQLVTKIYITIDKIDYQVDIDQIKQNYTVRVVGEDKKTTISMKDFTYKFNSLIKFNTKDKSNGERDHTVQFKGITDEIDYNWLYNGTKVATRIYDQSQFNLKKYMAPPKVIDFGKVVMAPMPGAIINVAVKVGDNVVDGQELLTMEAMKMQNLIKSERKGTIKTIKVEEGDAVAVDELLIEFE